MKKRLKEEFIETMFAGGNNIEGSIADIVVGFDDWYRASEENWSDDEDWNGGMSNLAEMAAEAKQELLNFISNRIDEQISEGDGDWEDEAVIANNDNIEAEEAAFTSSNSNPWGLDDTDPNLEMD